MILLAFSKMGAELGDVRMVIGAAVKTLVLLFAVDCYYLELCIVGIAFLNRIDHLRAAGDWCWLLVHFELIKIDCSIEWLLDGRIRRFEVESNVDKDDAFFNL